MAERSVDEIMLLLRAPFAPSAISWRVGSTDRDKKRGLALAYIDARDVMERLDDVVGPANWQNRYPHANGKTVCEIGIRVEGEWIWKANGAGDTDIEGDKGALSDALKRAAVQWGVGRYLYDLKSPWVAIEPAGRSYRIAQGEYARLEKVLLDHGAPPERSASSLKVSDANGDDAWARITREVEASFADCHSLVALAGLERDIAIKVKEERWPKAWRVSLRGLFDTKAKQLNQAAQAELDQMSDEQLDAIAQRQNGTPLSEQPEIVQNMAAG